MAKRTDMARERPTKAHAPTMITIAPVSVNGMYSTSRRLHDVLPSADHSVSMQLVHLKGSSVGGRDIISQSKIPSGSIDVTQLRKHGS